MQKEWNIMEAAILLDNYLKFLNNERTREEVIELTSKELRSLAKHQNIVIDDIFRNVNGIFFQMHSLESAYYGFTILKPASKLFQEIVDIYRTDFHKYEEILKKVRNIINRNECISDREFNNSIENIEESKEMQDFYNWLKEEEKLDTSACKNYISTLSSIDELAQKYNFINKNIYTLTSNEIHELLNNEKFMKINTEQEENFKLGLDKLNQYVNKHFLLITKRESSVNIDSFKTILIEKFARGYRINSSIELKRFRRYFEEMFGTISELGDEEILGYICSCGITYDNKVYMPQKMLDENIRIKLFQYINKNFQEGREIIYYEALFKEFSDDFLEYYMYNSDMLKAYLTYMNDDSYYINKNFIAKDDHTKVSAYNEVKQYLSQQGIPVECDKIYSALPHIPQQNIKNIFARYNEFIVNKRNEYFHISIFNISDEELDDISTLIKTTIEEKEFIGGNELVDSIKRKFPYIIEQNTLISDKGLRNAISYKLSSNFSFERNIISQKGQNLSMKKVFANFCKQRDSFTLDELKILKKELDTIIYFEEIYENSLRISKDQFIAKDKARFLTLETDKTIDRFCSDDYIPLGKITYFGAFPDAGFQWNSFLLEHYVAKYSPNYKLIHSNYNENICVGAIVKKVSKIDTIDELIVDVLANNKLPLQKEKSLQYLCDEGYLGRRSYAGIEQLLIKAKELRNQKGL